MKYIIKGKEYLLPNCTKKTSNSIMINRKCLDNMYDLLFNLDLIYI